MELGRTQSCRNTLDPHWGEEKFQLALSDHSIEETPALLMEVWAEDTRGNWRHFLGQVIQRAYVKIKGLSLGTGVVSICWLLGYCSGGFHSKVQSNCLMCLLTNVLG